MKNESFSLQIQEPSGEIRTISLKNAVNIGRSQDCDIRLKDPQSAELALRIYPISDGQWWFKSQPSGASVLLNGIRVVEGEFPVYSRLQVGETRIILQGTIDAGAAPESPRGLRKWHTRAESGRKALWDARKTAATELSIYLQGETGTGKEVLAHLIHAWSPRAGGSFVPLHCGALPASLAESELFGHVKGAFTGAVNHRPGALMQAHGGTLFLDEIGDLPLDIQVKLLRFLENGEIRPVGADRSSRADVRILCATHHSLEKLVREGRFRQDLYYRIASVTIQIPALRDRPEDIEHLAVQFATELRKSLSPHALLRLKSYPWPGNVRELRHAMERASGLAGVDRVLLHDDDFLFLTETNQEAVQSETLSPLAGIVTLAEMERALLIRTLRTTHGNRSAAARNLGIARSTLFEMLKRYSIRGPRMPE
jgi:transcriptional regulator with PAS, ATPase and Fis domain